MNLLQYHNAVMAVQALGFEDLRALHTALGLIGALVANETNVTNLACLTEELKNLKVICTWVNPLHEDGQVISQCFLPLSSVVVFTAE